MAPQRSVGEGRIELPLHPPQGCGLPLSDSPDPGCLPNNRCRAEARQTPPRPGGGGVLFCLVQGFEAFGAGDNFGAVGQSGRLQVRLLFPFGGGIEFGGAQTHPFPRHHSFFFAKLAGSGHKFSWNPNVLDSLLTFEIRKINVNEPIIRYFPTIGKGQDKC